MSPSPQQDAWEMQNPGHWFVRRDSLLHAALKAHSSLTAWVSSPGADIHGPLDVLTGFCIDDMRENIPSFNRYLLGVELYWKTPIKKTPFGCKPEDSHLFKGLSVFLTPHYDLTSHGLGPRCPCRQISRLHHRPYLPSRSPGSPDSPPYCGRLCVAFRLLTNKGSVLTR